MLATAWTLEAELVQKALFQSLGDLGSVHCIPVILRQSGSDTTLSQLSLVVVPLVRNDIAAAHTTDRNQHLGGLTD